MGIVLEMNKKYLSPFFVKPFRPSHVSQYDSIFFLTRQNQYHINFPNKKRLTPTGHGKLHVHPGNFKLSKPSLFGNTMMAILSQGWDVSVLSKGEEDCLRALWLQFAFLGLLIWLNRLSTNAFKLSKRNSFSWRKALPIFSGFTSSGPSFFFIFEGEEWKESAI